MEDVFAHLLMLLLQTLDAESGMDKFVKNAHLDGCWSITTVLLSMDYAELTLLMVSVILATMDIALMKETVCSLVYQMRDVPNGIQ